MMEVVVTNGADVRKCVHLLTEDGLRELEEALEAKRGQLSFWKGERRLREGKSLMLQCVHDHDVILAQPRLCGGGGDGGSTGAESRSAYLAMYAEKKKDKADRATTLFNRYGSCSLSGAALSPPLVCDAVGNIMNKEALLEKILDG